MKAKVRVRFSCSGLRNIGAVFSGPIAGVNQRVMGDCTELSQFFHISPARIALIEPLILSY
jgi:hypothetical protein